jgi:hypothetical protein
MLNLLITLFLLSPSALAETCTIIKQSPNSRLERCGNIDVLELRGTPVERARANGELLRDVLSKDVTEYFSEKIFDVTRDKPQFLAKILELFYHQIVRLLHRGAPTSLREELDAMSAAYGVDSIYLKRAISLPDTAGLLNALGSKSFLRSLPSAGCTSIAKKEGEKFVYGRNLDFAGAGIWDAHPMLTIILPPEGSGELKHIAFGAHGAHFGGITGVNEAGISFAVHQNYMKQASLYGVPMFFIGELVLREAKNLQEAEEILRRYRPAPLWTFVVSDLKTGETMAVESSGSHFAVRRMDSGLFAQTNHVMHQEVREHEFISLGTKLNSVHRMKIALQSLERLKGSSLEVAAFAKILSYQEDPQGQLSAYHDILKAHTIQTVLLSSAKGQPGNVYLSSDPAPTAAGRYQGFDWKSLWAQTEAPRNYEVVDFVKTPPAKRARQREISRAFHEYFDKHDFLGAAKLLEGHASLDAFLFRAIAQYQAKQFEESINIAQQALNNPRFLSEPSYIMQSVQWVRIAALLRLQRFGEARSISENLRDSNPPNLRLKEFVELIASGKEPPAWMLKNIAFEFFSGDMSGRER